MEKEGYMADKKYNGKHLTLSDRQYIEDSLNCKVPLKEIAFGIHKDPTTISKEILRYRIEARPKTPNRMVHCEKYRNCAVVNLCNGYCNGRCSRCRIKNCLRFCTEYVPEKCHRIKSFKHVCNGCTYKNGCTQTQYQYHAKAAHIMYKDVLSSARAGIHLTEEEFKDIDLIVSKGILKGQPLAHIYINHKSLIPCSQRTLYSYIDKNLLAVKNIDLRRKVKYKPRRKQRQVSLREKKYAIGRKYVDFVEFMRANPDVSVVEMDTVHGGVTGKVLLTFLFRSCSLMLAFLLDSCSKDCVKKVLDHLETKMGKEIFAHTFPVLLTDNGSEFKASSGIEQSVFGGLRTRVFYCDPYNSGQKGRLEKNHEFIRYIVPKGKSFDGYKQMHITKMINHINSITRASLNGNTPFKLALMLVNPIVINALSLEEIPASEVNLKSSLLKY